MNLLQCVRAAEVEYLEDCAYFGEAPQRDGNGVNPYCDHARELRERRRNVPPKSQSHQD